MVFFQNDATLSMGWSGERRLGLNYFWKVDHCRIFESFSRNWLGMIILSEILQLDILKIDFLCYKKCPHDSIPPTRPMPHAPTRHLYQWKTLGFCTFIHVWSIRSWARITEFVNNLKSQQLLLAVSQKIISTFIHL